MGSDILITVYRMYNEKKIKARYAWINNIKLAFYAKSKLYRRIFASLAKNYKKKYVVYNNIANQLWQLIKQDEKELGNNDL